MNSILIFVDRIVENFSNAEGDFNLLTFLALIAGSIVLMSFVITRILRYFLSN